MVVYPAGMGLPSYPYKIAVLCDLRDSNGRVLLLHRLKDPNRGMYSPIGGKLDTATGESPAQCAQREIKEESGIDVAIDRLHLGGMISERGYEDQTNWLLFWYRVTVPVWVEPHDMNEGRLEWHDPARIDELSLPETDRKIIWPLVRQHEGGFFAVHIDCSGGGLVWKLEQSQKRGL